MNARTQRYLCLALGVSLVIGGSLATGLVPSELPYQLVAGGIIVAGFAVVFACLGVFEFEEI